MAATYAYLYSLIAAPLLCFTCHAVETLVSTTFRPHVVVWGTGNKCNSDWSCLYVDCSVLKCFHNVSP